ISLGEAGNVFRRAPEALRRRVRSIGAAPEPRRAGPIRTILAACDGSDGGETAARGAIALAGALGARVVVLGAYEPAADGGRRTVGRVLSSPGPDRGTVEAGLSRVADEVAGAGVEVSVDARPGEPAAAILDAAEESAADLIVVGDRGMRNRSRHLLGSVADRVSHHAPCSVLIVRS
ncbi:MAG: universal stress protein, partial [Thermoleophilaceae bacterium]